MLVVRSAFKLINSLELNFFTSSIEGIERMLSDSAFSVSKVDFLRHGSTSLCCLGSTLAGHITFL